MVVGPPQLKVIFPPAALTEATAAPNAASVQLAAEPVPTTTSADARCAKPSPARTRSTTRAPDMEGFLSEGERQHPFYLCAPVSEVTSAGATRAPSRPSDLEHRPAVPAAPGAARRAPRGARGARPIWPGGSRGPVRARRTRGRSGGSAGGAGEGRARAGP